MIIKYTRWGTVALASFQSIAAASWLQNQPGLNRNISAGVRNRHRAFRAIDQLQVKSGLQFPDRMAERGLRDEAGIGGTAEMPVFDKCQEIAELPQAREFRHGANISKNRINNPINTILYIINLGVHCLPTQAKPG